MHAKSYAGSGQTSRSSQTFAPSVRVNLLRSTSSQAASRARTSAAPEPVSVLPAEDRACGESSIASSASANPAASLSRTSQSFDPAVSTLCSETLPRAGTMRSGIVFPLPASAPRTSAIDYSSSGGNGPHLCLFPTPTASAYGSSGNAGGNNKDSAGRLSLEAMARTGLWPTPTVGDSRSAARHTTTTGKSHSATTLTDAVRGFSVELSSGSSGQRSNTGELSPAWVEWLMGFPVGWTVSPVWEMQLSLL